MMTLKISACWKGKTQVIPMGFILFLCNIKRFFAQKNVVLGLAACQDISSLAGVSLKRVVEPK